MKNLLIAAILGSTALTGAAFAQGTTTTGTDAAQPADAGSQMEGGFITWQAQDQMVASNLMGAAAWGAENEVIGTVDDLLLDREGEIIGVIIGVGGFLGLGERDVAISTDELEFVLTQDTLAAGGVPGAPAGATVQDPALQPGGMAADGTLTPAPGGTVGSGQTGMAGTTAPGATGMAPGAAGTAETGATGAGTVGTGAGTVATGVENAATGVATGVENAATGVATGVENAATGVATGMENAATGVGTGVGMNGWAGQVIDHIQVNYTREELENAPAFERVE